MYTLTRRRSLVQCLVLLLLTACSAAGNPPAAGMQPAEVAPAPIPTLTATVLPPPIARTSPAATADNTTSTPPAAELPVIDAVAADTSSDVQAPANSVLTATPEAPAAPTPIRLAVPAGWETALQTFLEQLPDSPWEWQVSGAAEPAAELAAGRAELALAAGGDGISAGSRPLALAVPFATDWQNTDLAHAQSIVANGHSLVQVMPWDEIRPPLRALHVNGFHPSEAGYPLQQPYGLQSAAGSGPAAQFLAPYLTQFVVDDQSVEVAATGDINLDRALGAIIAGGRVDFPFEQVAPILQAADISVGNFESALGDVGEPANKSYAFRSPPVAAESVARAGFDVVTLANNHALDYGPDALLQGLELLRAQQLATIGAGPDAAAARSPAILESNGLRLAFLGYVQVPVEGNPPYFDTSTWTATDATPGLAWAKPDEIAADVRAARAQSDLVIVVLHSGMEYVSAPSPEQMAASYAAIDAGASLVIGHHAHILQGVEFYNGGVIVYGLANFAFNIIGPPESAILRAWLDKDGVRTIEFVPVLVQENGQPRLADENEAALIRKSIYDMSGGLVH